MNALDPIVWSILLLAAGCALVVLEVFFPSGGFLGVLSCAAFVAAIGMAFYYHGTMAGMALLLFSSMLVPVVLAVAIKYWPITPMGRAFLGDPPTEEEVTPEDPRRSLIGRVGIAHSKMLPAGAVLIDNQLVDAVSQGMAIDPDQYVVVTEVRANRVVVRPANDHERPVHEDPDSLLSRPIEELGIEDLDIDGLNNSPT